MEKPEWLGRLNRLDRARASRWIDEVGENGFLAIATVATSKRREPHRPRQDNSEFVRAAIFYWVTHPELDESKAATAVAADFRHAAAQGHRVHAMTFHALRRIMFDTLKGGGPPIGLVIEACEEAEKRGLPVRPELKVAAISELNLDTYLADAAISRRFGLVMAEPAMPRHLTQLASQISKLGSVTRAVGMRPEDLDRVRRVVHVIRALEGILPPGAPISRATALLDDLVEAAKGRAT